jgi:hypothetical protein
LCVYILLATGSSRVVCHDLDSVDDPIIGPGLWKLALAFSSAEFVFATCQITGQDMDASARRNTIRSLIWGRHYRDPAAITVPTGPGNKICPGTEKPYECLKRLMLLEGNELSTSPLPKQWGYARALILLAFWTREMLIFATCSEVS